MKPKWSKLSHKSVLVSRGGFSQLTKCQEYLQQDCFPDLAMALTTRVRWFAFFLQKIFRPTNFWVSVTKRNFSVYMGYFHNVSYTPHQYYPSDRIFWRKGKNGFSSFSCFLFGQMVPYAFKSSSVTKRNNVACMELLWCAPIYVHWCYIGDRKSLYWEKGPKVPKCA